MLHVVMMQLVMEQSKTLIIGSWEEMPPLRLVMMHMPRAVMLHMLRAVVRDMLRPMVMLMLMTLTQTTQQVMVTPLMMSMLFQSIIGSILSISRQSLVMS
jgi:hypothetical protein